MVPTTLLYPLPDSSLEPILRLPADLAADASDASNADQAIRTMDYDGAFAVMSMGCLVIAGAFAFYDLFGQG
jgi:hypothetical protein